MLSNHQDMFRGLEVTLDSGITVSMKSLSQRVTYLELLEGLPSKELNDRIINNLTNSSRYLLYETRSDFRFDDPRRNRREFEFLPYITCMASLEALVPARDETAHQSFLEVFWFQDAWAMPLAPEVVTALKVLDWKRLATDGWY